MAILVEADPMTLRVGSPYVAGDAVTVQVVASSFGGAVVWSDNGAGGSFAVVDAVEALYTPANRTQQVTLKATSDANNAQTVVQIFATFPLRPQREYTLDFDDDTQAQDSRDFSDVRRVDGGVFAVWSLPMANREPVQVNMLRDFWLFHRKKIDFFYFDTELDELVYVKFDSGVRRKPHGAQNFDMSCTVKGLYAT